MKINLLSTAYPYRGGIAVFTERLARAFQMEKDDVNITTFSLQYPNFLFPGKSQYSSSERPTDIKITSEVNSINPFNWIKVATKINKEKPDLVIIRYWLPFMSPCLGTIARLLNKKIKILAITDNVIPHEKRLGDRFLTAYFIKSCDAYLTLSKSVLEDLTQFTKSAFKKFIPHPIYDTFGEKVSKSEAIQNLALNSRDRYLLFFGFIRKYKGLDLMLKAMTDDRIKDLGVKLIVAGEFYEDKEEYISLINTLGIKSQVILHSAFISSDDVKNYFCASDMITQTYKTATQSGVTQIAYHFERPMLVTDVGGLAEIVPNDRVGYVTSQDPNDISDVIVDFYENNREKEFSLNTKKEKKRFSWESFIDGIDKLMESLQS